MNTFLACTVQSAAHFLSSTSLATSKVTPPYDAFFLAVGALEAGVHEAAASRDV